VVGYHLGGGLPLLGRTFGYAADRVRALDVVTADGQTRTLTPDDDLFRAMLGCRGAFGVVTSLVTEALPLTSVTGGGLWFTGDGIEPAVRAYLRWTADVPETVNSSVLLIRLPDLPVIPEPIRGRRIAHVRIAAVGGEVDLAPLRAVAPVLDTVAELPAARLSSIHDEPSVPVLFKARNALLGPLDDAAATVLLDHARAARSSSSSATSAAPSPRAGPWSAAATPTTSSTPAPRCPTRPRRRRRPPRRPRCTTRSRRGASAR
jgi:FAD/FMN-containing dehydrogenase